MRFMNVWKASHIHANNVRIITYDMNMYTCQDLRGGCNDTSSSRCETQISHYAITQSCIRLHAVLMLYTLKHLCILFVQSLAAFPFNSSELQNLLLWFSNCATTPLSEWAWWGGSCKTEFIHFAGTLNSIWTLDFQDLSWQNLLWQNRCRWFSSWFIEHFISTYLLFVYIAFINAI